MGYVHRLVKVPSVTCTTGTDGLFASTVEFYSRCRKPYTADFFHKVAEHIGLRGVESLLDVCFSSPILKSGLLLPSKSG